MNFKSVSQNYRISRFSLIIFTSVSVLIFLMYSIFHSFLFNVSINALYKFNSSSPSFLYFKYINKFFNMNLIYVIMLIFYNSANVYKTFILFCEIIVSKYISGLFKLIYLHPKPAYDSKLNELNVYKNNNLNPYWGYPNEALLLYPLFYLSIWKILTKKLFKTSMQLRIKFISLCLIVIIISLYAISEFLLCNASIDQIMFSMMISLLLYYFIFSASKINFSDNRQFYKLIKYSFKKISFCILILLLIPLIIFYKQTYSNNGKTILSEYDSFIDPNSKILSFNKEALSSCFLLISLGTLFLGCRTEIHVVFVEQFANWTQFNFEPNDDNVHSLSGSSYDTSLSERISITKTAQWNHTNRIVSLGRAFLIIILVFLCFLPGMFIGWDSNFGAVLVIKIGLCWGLLTSGMMLWFKIVARLCGLTNTTLWTMIRESV